MALRSEITVRDADVGDAADVSELAAATFAETFGHLYAPEDLDAFLAEARSVETYAELLADPAVMVSLALEGAKPVGYVLAGPCKLPVTDLEPSAGEVRELYLLRSQQGRGLGTTLLEGALRWLEEHGRLPVYVGVWSENAGAQRLYGRYGFEKVGEYDFPVGEHVDREYILRQGG